jgi:hypothetical protein
VYISSGSVGDVVSYFNASALDESVLAIFIPKDHEDADSLRWLFDRRGSLSPFLANVAFFLFSSNIPFEKTTTRNPSISDFLMIPGLSAVLPSGAFRHRDLWTGDRRAWTAPHVELASYVTNDVKDDVVLRGQHVSGELAEYFGLDAADLPCILFLAKNDLQPFVVKTQGSADMGLFLDMVQRFDSIAELAKAGPLSIPVRHARQKVLDAEVDRLSKQLQEAGQTVLEALAVAACDCKNTALAETVKSMSAGEAHQLFRHLGLLRNDKRPLPVPQEVKNAAFEEFQVQRTHEHFRAVVNLGKRRQHIEQQLQDAQSRQAVEASALTRLANSKSTDLKTIEDLLERTCEEFEKRFLRSNRWMSLKKFFGIITGTAKAIEGLTTSVGSTVDGIAKRL